MGTRIDLHGKLLEIGGRAYYNPPSSAKMQYPCFVYKLSDVKSNYADNRVYKKSPCYTVIYISSSIADEMIDTMLDRFQHCRFNGPYKADGLNHYPFTIFY